MKANPWAVVFWATKTIVSTKRSKAKCSSFGMGKKNTFKKGEPRLLGLDLFSGAMLVSGRVLHVDHVEIDVLTFAFVGTSTEIDLTSTLQIWYPSDWIVWLYHCSVRGYDSFVYTYRSLYRVDLYILYMIIWYIYIMYLSIRIYIYYVFEYIYIHCIYIVIPFLQSQMKRLLLRISTNQPSGFSLFLLTCYTSKLSELHRLLYVQCLIYLFLQIVWGDSFL